MFFSISFAFWAILSFQILFAPTVRGFSGFYVDNGLGQTVMEESIPEDSTELMRHHILQLLELPDRPDSERFQSIIKQTVPKFLFKIYKRLSEKDDEINEDGLRRSHRSYLHDFNESDGITTEHARIIENSDIIMTFLNNRNAFTITDHHNETRLSFDLSEVSSHGNELLMSELHLFKRQLPEKHIDSNLCQITISVPTFVDKIKKLRPIFTANSTVSFEGWIQVNVTSLLSEWIVNKRPNNMLYISIEYANENGQFDTPSVDVNYLLNYWDSEHQPFITAYFKSNESKGHTLPLKQKHRRSKRSVRRPRRRNQFHHSSSPRNPLTHLNKGQNQTRDCQRYILYVSFEELRWNDWILAPRGYGAFYCAGSCNFPFPHHVDATNHAVIQTLAHLFQSHDIPKPCCAPSKLQAISLLYSQNEIISNIRRYRGMVAGKCACQ